MEQVHSWIMKIRTNWLIWKKESIVMSHHLWVHQWHRKLTKAHKTIMNIRRWANIGNNYSIIHKSYRGQRILLSNCKLHVGRVPSRSRAILEEDRKFWRIKIRTQGSASWMWQMVAYLSTETKEAHLQHWINILTQNQLLKIKNQPIRLQRDLPDIRPSSNPN